MSTIKVTPEQLHHVSNQVDQARQQLESIRSDLTRQIMFVQMMWMGATQERFYYEFEQSRPILDKALESMVNTSKELKDIATRFQDADAQKVSLGGAFGAVGAVAMMTKSTGDSGSGDKGYRMAQVNMFGKWVWMPVNENGVADQAALQAYQRDQGNLDFNRMQAVNVEPPGEDIFALQIKAFEMGIHPTTGEPVSDKYAQMMVTSLKFSQIFMAIQMVRGSMPGGKGPYRLPASSPAVAKIKQHIEAAKAKNSKVVGPSSPIPVKQESYKEVNIHGKLNSEIDEVDLKNKIIYEDKSAKKLYMDNPNVPQTEEQWALKQIFKKGSNRITALQQTEVKLSSSVSQDVPLFEDITNIRKYVFRIDADTPKLRSAVQNELNNLKTKYPDYNFSAEFGGKE
ncbi:WXG100 family type VII secretion target [Paenibacillus polymyxa]|uniref:WXG100 family type VII secretion target n=1 Tax=Paenibacillus polymyxa TaxID=1406 RepID=UPI001BE563DB|nr:WXG100 family type VII secretion target [Paenibacillus polymyxa]MBT2284934.1 WXG100 family type VII secretion target [Paenibacillus polymyxa]